MDKKTTESKTIKTIVPIKGNLLEKIKNKLKHNGSNSTNPEENDALNNNKQENEKVPKIPASNKKSSKIQITKIEKVNLEINDLIKSTKSEVHKTAKNVILREPSLKPLRTLPFKFMKNDSKIISNDVHIETITSLPKNDAIDITPIVIPHIEPPSTSKSLESAIELVKNVVPKEEDIKNVETINNNNNNKNKNNDDDVSAEEEEGECMDIGDEAWLHDISVMIGESRIREIDQGLKKIPTIVTGNRIQTENVELKLIINHLLGKLNAKSVVETIESTSSSFFKNIADTTNDYSDSFDGIPTDTDEDTHSKIHPPSEIKEEEKVKDLAEPSSFSIPLENSIAIVTIPTISEPEMPKQEVKDEIESVDPPISNEIVENIQKTKKRRGRPPLAASTAKKSKQSSIPGKSNIKEETSVVTIDHPRKLSLRISSRESSVESTKGSIISDSKSLMGEQNKKELPKRSGSREKLTKTTTEIELKINNNNNKNKKVTRVEELKLNENENSAKSKISESSSSSESEPKKHRGRAKKLSPFKSESSQKITDFFKSDSDHSKDTSTEIVKDIAKELPKKANGQNKSTTRGKRKIILSDSESDSECETTLSKLRELKSVTLSDSNSQQPIQSSILERYDYLKHKSSSSADNTKNTSLITDHPICAELKEAVDKCKEDDSTYLKPPEVVKRPYLRTSAFVGNHNNSDDSSYTDSCTRPPSVSLDDSSINNDNDTNESNNVKNNGIKDIMNELIKKHKERIKISLKEEPKSTDSTPPLSPMSDSVKAKESRSKKSENKKSGGKSKSNQVMSTRHPRKTVERTPKIKQEEAVKKIFEQEQLEKSIEKLVNYNEILEAIRITDPPRKNGRASSAVKPIELKKKTEYEMKLKNLEYFKCGSCTCLVTKHKWKDHVMDHGGIAWIETFESPIDINDWNEAVRRLINYMRIFKLESLQCPNCNCAKRSAVGHLSHIYTCGEDEDTIESRKIACQYCEKRIMPYNMSWHRAKCEVLNKVKNPEPVTKADDGDDEEEENEENSKGSSITNSGRTKRKAGKKAVKKFKVFLKKLNDDPMDHIIVKANGQSICSHCNEKFNTSEMAVEHFNKIHFHQKDGMDFEGSSSDATIIENESSETDGSSGVESSDIQSAEEDEEQVDSINISNSKGKSSSYESVEIKNGRRLITPYTESFSNAKISGRTIKLTKKFIDENLCDNILTEFMPKYKIKDSTNLASYFSSSSFEFKSIKFVISMNDNYNLAYGKKPNQEWKQLEAGCSIGDKNSLVLYCGGSVSSLDWSQSLDEKNFLAVACNSDKDRRSNLEETSKSCIQIYQFEHLVNDKFSTFENVSKFLFFFAINEGPIWCIKFHPFVKASNERIGLLAVTTSNHHVYIYSIPYLKCENNPVMINLEPSFICKTIEGFWLYQEKYLMQATIVSWLFRKEQDLHLLGAGFINGMVSIWKFNDIDKSDEDEQTLLPLITFQPHREPITGLDFKHMIGSEIYMLTTSLDRDVKVFTIDGGNFQEISTFYASSRILCAEWWIHWPGFVCGNDNCYAHGTLLHRQPIEFATRYIQLFYCISSVVACNLNHWLNFGIFATDGGDVLSTNPGQLFYANPKDRWGSFANNVISYTDILHLEPKNENSEVAIVFYDMKSKLAKRPKDFRTPPSSDIVNQLQINKISFNRNEMSYRFYALGYETGFVRIRHLKNSK